MVSTLRHDGPFTRGVLSAQIGSTHSLHVDKKAQRRRCDKCQHWQGRGISRSVHQMICNSTNDIRYENLCAFVLVLRTTTVLSTSATQMASYHTKGTRASQASTPHPTGCKSFHSGKTSCQSINSPLLPAVCLKILSTARLTPCVAQVKVLVSAVHILAHLEQTLSNPSRYRQL